MSETVETYEPVRVRKLLREAEQVADAIIASRAHTHDLEHQLAEINKAVAEERGAAQ